MARKGSSDIYFPFYEYLWHFYDANRKKIKASYKPLTRKFLDYNDPADCTNNKIAVRVISQFGEECTKIITLNDQYRAAINKTTP